MTVRDRLYANRKDALDRLFEIIKIKSISTDPAFAPHCIKAADWFVQEFKQIGFKTKIINKGGHPFVVAKSPWIEGAKHVLFYGHYDVQPVDPLELWERDPFDPAIIERDGVKVIHGRGSSDDKGQILTFIEACRAYYETEGALPLNVTVMLEGEEESGSPSLTAFLKDHHDEIMADLVLVCDTGMADRETPSICSQLRGLMAEEIILESANTDLHSGLYGGAAQNPAHVLVKILSSMRDDQGRVTIPGFYDDVPEISPEIKTDWDKLAHLGNDLLRDVGLTKPAGEKRYSVLEQIWARPTLEINGLVSGYTGEGTKTVLPKEARVKLSLRLVGQQDPDKIRAALRKFVTESLPHDCKVRFEPHSSGRSSNMDTNHPDFQKVREAVSGIWKNKAIFVGMGGSIPIVGRFEGLGMPCMLLGFALPSDQIHAPNEKYDLQSFEKGAEAWVSVLETFGN